MRQETGRGLWQKVVGIISLCSIFILLTGGHACAFEKKPWPALKVTTLPWEVDKIDKINFLFTPRKTEIRHFFWKTPYFAWGYRMIGAVKENGRIVPKASLLGIDPHVLSIVAGVYAFLQREQDRSDYWEDVLYQYLKEYAENFGNPKILVPGFYVRQVVEKVWEEAGKDKDVYVYFLPETMKKEDRSYGFYIFNPWKTDKIEEITEKEKEAIFLMDAAPFFGENGYLSTVISVLAWKNLENIEGKLLNQNDIKKAIEKVLETYVIPNWIWDVYSSMDEMETVIELLKLADRSQCLIDLEDDLLRDRYDRWNSIKAVESQLKEKINSIFSNNSYSDEVLDRLWEFNGSISNAFKEWVSSENSDYCKERDFYYGTGLNLIVPALTTMYDIYLFVPSKISRVKRDPSLEENKWLRNVLENYEKQGGKYTEIW